MKPWVKVSTCPVGKIPRHIPLPVPRLECIPHSLSGRTRLAGRRHPRPGLPDDVFSWQRFLSFALDWQEQSNGRQIIPGLGIYFLDPSEGNWTLDEIERQINFIRTHGLAGEAHYARSI